MNFRKYKSKFVFSFEKEEFEKFQVFLITCAQEDKKIGFNRLFDKNESIILKKIMNTLGFYEKRPEGVQNAASNMTSVKYDYD